LAAEDLILAEYYNVVQRYNKLLFPKINGQGWVIEGAIDVIDDDGGFWDTYLVNIFIPASYPDELPVLFEVGNKIDKSMDWHNIDGACCLSTTAKMFFEMEGKCTLLMWLDKFAHPFLANHVYKMQTGAYAHGEFSHGIPGIIQGYSEIFNLSKNEEIVERLMIITGRKAFGRNDPCFCQSGKKYKKCYLLNIEKHFMGIPFQIMQQDLDDIIKSGSK
jgi:hypothetical protein